jgi:hypothetical protein
MKRHLAICLLLLCAFAASATAQRTTTKTTTLTKSSALSAAEIQTVHTAFRTALRSATTRAAARTVLLGQLRTRKPIAFAKGYWVVPVDVAAIYTNSTIQPAIVTQLGTSTVAARLNQLATIGVGDRLGLVFVPNHLGADILGVSVADVRGSLAKAAFLQNTTDMMMGPGDVIEGAQMGVTGAVGVFNLSKDMLGNLADAFTNWWTGSGPKDPNTGLELDDPNADPDGDNVPNRLDGDDDGDGTNDEDDQAPYDPGTQICFDCMGRTLSATFTNTASSGVLAMAFNAHTAAKSIATRGALISLGTVANVNGQNAGLQIGF